jgi:hypothetical protein
MGTDGFLEELTLLTPQQREQVRGAFQVALVESPLPTVLTDLEGRILGTNRLVEELPEPTRPSCKAGSWST